MTGALIDQDVSSPQAARALPPDEFQRIFVDRNRGVVAAEDQARISAARILVAGCGSIGGAAVEPLVRLGFRSLVLADPGSYELTNLNRQNATVDDLGRNKAAVAADRARAINPHVVAEVATDGVTEERVDALLAGVDVVIDGVDVTTRSGLAAKGLLHERARDRGLPLMTGWDMSGTQHVRVYDYRREQRLFGGAVTRRQLDEMPLWELLARLVPARKVPRDLVGLIRRGLHREEFTFPQLVQAADMFGILAATLTVRLVTGRPVPSSATVDVHRLAMPSGERLWDRLRQPVEVAGLLLAMTRGARRRR
ncbi:ThiF family adenylyltransferase [Micromonospora halotolerans]|uniref:ThiF family adenylyltransferase n=1 Tax=Micromonospora halotolerans TaxID=709879 RepID=A0ABY9ZPW2_9ACTN|nr:ThiF family adenylyltransferase [Micromonospora halotolerans]WNM37299.1 ThiF family adenylyltransferase [Micromonospora halotolerans]